MRSETQIEKILSIMTSHLRNKLKISHVSDSEVEIVDFMHIIIDFLGIANW